MKITLTGDDKALQVLNKWAQIETVIYSWMKSGQVDDIVQKSIRLNFGREGRPDKWQYLAESTIQQRDYEGYDDGPILQRTGNLMEAVSSIMGRVTTGGKEVQMSWGIDQLSGKEKLKFATHQAGSGKIPQRQMLGFQNADATNLSRSLRDWIIIQMQ